MAKRPGLSLRSRGINKGPGEEETPSIPDTPAISTKEPPRPTKKPTKGRSTTAKKAPGGRVVRDSFTAPEEDYALIAKVQQRCLKQGIPMTKGETLRAGLKALSLMTDRELSTICTAVEKVKTGRPIE